MSNIVQVSYYNTSDPRNEIIDAELVLTTGDNAEPTGRLLDGSEDHGYAEEWQEAAMMPDGRPCYRMYLFTSEEVAAAGEEAENYPWDHDHVARIILNY